MLKKIIKKLDESLKAQVALFLCLMLLAGSCAYVGLTSDDVSAKDSKQSSPKIIEKIENKDKNISSEIKGNKEKNKNVDKKENIQKLNKTEKTKTTETVDSSTSTSTKTSTKETTVSKSTSQTSTANKQVSVSKPAPVTPKDTTKPVISGVSNVTIEYGASFNAMSGISASDNIDGNITSRISISGSVNSSVSGNYTLTYNVSDNAGNTTSVSRIVTVKEKPVIVVHETSLENQLFSLVNNYRNQNGVESIQYSGNQYSKANSLAKSKADANNLNSSHYANEISIVYGGPRPSASQLLNMWKASPSHNDFLLNTRKHYGGCAIYSNGNTFYVILEARIDDR